MKDTIEKRLPFILITLAALVMGILILTLLKNIPVIRYFFSDVVIIIFIFGSIKTLFPDLSTAKTSLGILIFAFFVEFLQYLGIPKYFGTKKFLVMITLGSTFDWMDIIAYITGFVVILIVSQLRKIYKRRSKQ